MHTKHTVMMTTGTAITALADMIYIMVTTHTVTTLMATMITEREVHMPHMDIMIRMDITIMVRITEDTKQITDIHVVMDITIMVRITENTKQITDMHVVMTESTSLNKQ